LREVEEIGDVWGAGAEIEKRFADRSILFKLALDNVCGYGVADED
jgi:hypothetical protein